MKKIMKIKESIITTAISLLFIMPLTGCFKSWPVDQDGLLITTNRQCAVLKFDVLDTRDVSALADSLAVIDTVALTINARVKWNADMTKLWPVFTLATDCKLDPKITKRCDFSQPLMWTVVSGDRTIRKTYTVTLTQVQK